MSERKHKWANYRDLSIEEKEIKCKQYFSELAEKLEGKFELIGSCNRDKTIYLVPVGTANEITYHGKPIGSFRISDHWNWKANLKRNPNERHIQCITHDMPFCHKRKEEGKASDPIYGWMVAYYDKDHFYHCIYGEKYDHNERKWSWIETPVDEMLSKIKMEGEKDNNAD